MAQVYKQEAKMEQVYRYIDENKEMYVEWLQDLCKLPSVSAQNRSMKETAERVKTYLSEVGVSVEILEMPGQHPIVYGQSSRDKKSTISFYNHYDVQPEEPIELWESSPFGAEIREGKLIARGSADNKGALMARICAVHAYQKVNGELPVNIKFLVEGEEESGGSQHIKHLAATQPELLQADLCIWENGFVNNDGSFEVKLGNKGILTVKLVAKSANTDLHSSNAGIIENPAWRLVWALNTLKSDRGEVLIKHFYDKVAKPTEREKEILEQMDLEEEEMLARLGLDHFILNLRGNELKEKLVFQPTCNICGIHSGYTGKGKTVLPSEAWVKIDFRLVPNQVPKEILQHLRNHLDNHGFQDIKILASEGTQASKTDPGDPFVKKVMEAATKLKGIPPRIILMNPGSGPMYDLCQQLGIPAVGFGVGNSDSRKHAPNENILIKDYLDGIKMAATVIHEWA